MGGLTLEIPDISKHSTKFLPAISEDDITSFKILLIFYKMRGWLISKIPDIIKEPTKVIPTI